MLLKCIRNILDCTSLCLAYFGYFDWYWHSSQYNKKIKKFDFYIKKKLFKLIYHLMYLDL